MPGRLIPLVTNEIYHIFNRGIASQPIFLDKRDYTRALDTFFYYQNVEPPVKYSRFLSLSLSERSSLLEELRKKQYFLVEIIAYCLMPNHFHALMRQREDDGISKFVSNFTNSYTRFFNTKRERRGPLFEGKFKSVRIENDEQLMHVSRYIHLNPYTGFVVKTLQELKDYPYFSFQEYINKVKLSFCVKDVVLTNFENKDSYKEFVYDQANYQRLLDQIKHLTFES